MSESLNKVNDWLQEMGFKIDLEEDQMEKSILTHRRNHVQNNFKHYISHRVKKGDEHYFCKECNVIEFGDYMKPTGPRMKEKQVCFHCDFWQEKEKEHLVKPFLIINGNTFSDGGNKPNERNKSFLGYSGCVFTIRMLDGSKEWTTNNLWNGGDIPKKYRLTTMSDNAEFIRG